MRCHILPAGTGSFIEMLESRQLLSAAPLQSAVAVAPLLVVGPISAPTGANGTLHEQAGVPFTASLGTFVTLAPAKNLQAAINWGDGTASEGTLIPSGVVGLDELQIRSGRHAHLSQSRYVCDQSHCNRAWPDADVAHSNYRDASRSRDRRGGKANFTRWDHQRNVFVRPTAVDVVPGTFSPAPAPPAILCGSRTHSSRYRDLSQRARRREHLR